MKLNTGSPSISSSIVRTTKTGNFTVVAGDINTVLDIISGSPVVSLTAAATIGSGFSCWIINSGTGLATIYANGAETIDGNASSGIALRQGSGYHLYCDGAGWKVIGIKTSGGTGVGPVGVQLGWGSQATAIGGMAVGVNATTSATYGSALGASSNGAGAQSVTGSGAMALAGSYAAGADSLAAAIANNTSTYGAQGANSIALGQSGKVTSANGVNLAKAGLVTGTSAVCLADGGTAGGDYSLVTGRNSSSNGIYGKIAHASNPIHVGADQTAKYVYSGVPGGFNLEYRITTNGNSASTNNQCVLANYSAHAFILLAVMRDSTGVCGAYKIEGLIKRGANAASTALVGTPSTTVIGEENTSWYFNVLADTTNGALGIVVNNGTPIKDAWCTVTLWTSEVTSSG